MDIELLSTSPDISVLAKAALNGDEAAAMALHDLIEERGMQMFSLEVGKNYIIRTLSFIYVGKLKSHTFSEIVLSEASWIPETARWSDTLTQGVFNDIEPFRDDVHVNCGHITDVTEFAHALPKERK